MNTEYVNPKPHQLDLFEPPQSQPDINSSYPFDKDEERSLQERSPIKTQQSEIIVKHFPNDRLH